MQADQFFRIFLGAYDTDPDPFIVGIQNGGGDEVLDARCVSSLAKRRYEVRELENALNS